MTTRASLKRPHSRRPWQYASVSFGAFLAIVERFGSDVFPRSVTRAVQYLYLYHHRPCPSCTHPQGLPTPVATSLRHRQPLHAFLIEPSGGGGHGFSYLPPHPPDMAVLEATHSTFRCPWESQ